MAFIVKRGRKQIGPTFKTYTEAQKYAMEMLEQDKKGIFNIEEIE